MYRISVSCLIFIAVFFASAARAEAHANIARSEPVAGISVEQTPSQVLLEFSEELDPSFTRVQLFDSANQIINAGPGVIDPANNRVLLLELEALPKGTYTAIWRARSAVDGHVTEGSVPFGVGATVSNAALIPPPGTPDPATKPPPIGSSLVRWLNLLAAALMLGGLPFALVVWRPTFRAVEQEAKRTKERENGIDTAMGMFIRRCVVVGGALLLVASVLFLIEQAATAAGVSLLQALGTPFVQILGSRTGMIGVARLGLAAVLMVLALRLPAPGAGAGWSWLLALGLGAALLLTFSLNSHGAAEQNNAAIATALDWLHITASVVWLGGLVPLAAVLWRARRGKDQTMPLSMLIPRFSVVSLVCVAVLTASGIYSYLLHVGDPRLLLDTTYGRALTFKIAAFVLLIGFGAWNVLVLSPGLRKANTSLARSFRRTVAVELVIGATVLLAVGVMTSVAPSKTAWAEQDRLGISRQASAPGVDLRLQIAPAQIGNNEFAVDLRDTRPGTQNSPAEVLLRFTMVGMDMGQLEAQLTEGQDGRYLTRGNYMSMGGRWQVELIVRRTGMEDIRQSFDMDIVKAAR